MRISFYNNPYDRFRCWLANKYEDFTQWFWHSSPHKVKCVICGDEMHSSHDRYSPEQCGWRKIKGGPGWICHICECHRNFEPYMKLINLDEEILWNPKDQDVEKQLMKKREEILFKMWSDQYEKNNPESYDYPEPW